MPTREEMIAEVERRRLIEEVEAKRAGELPGMDIPPGEWQGAADPYYRKAKANLDSAAGTALEGVGKASQFVDQYTGAPVRAGVEAFQKNQPVAEAVANQLMLRDAEAAPTGKELMVNAGISDEQMETPFEIDSVTGEPLTLSPAGVAGGLAEAALDPVSYIPGAAMAKGARGVGGVVDRTAGRLAKGLGELAEERAVKAATGESKKHLKKIAGASGMRGVRATGRTLLEADAAGPPAVGWFSKAEDIGANAEAKRKFYGGEIGAVGDTVDRLAPGAIKPQDIADEVAQYGQTIPNAGKGAPVRRRVAEEAELINQYGMTPGTQGPARPMAFGEAQNLKGQYPWEPQSPDLLISNKDASNKIHQIINQRMEQAAERASMNAATPDDIALLQKYGADKKKYGIYKEVSDAGKEQALNTLNRRVVSPSSHLLGAATGAVEAAKSGLAKGGLKGAAVAAANQTALSRGAAFSARLADSISKRMATAPRIYQKWLPKMQMAAKGGNVAIVSLHHQLMNADPEYRRLMGAEEEPIVGPPRSAMGP